MAESIAPETQYLTVAEFAQLTTLSPKTVWRRLADGSLPKFQPGGPGTRVTIPREAALGVSPSATPSDVAQHDHPIESRTKIPGPMPKWLR